MEAISFRAFQSDDLAMVKDLIDLTIDACYTAFYPARAVQFFKDYHSNEAILADCAVGFCLVAVCGDTIIGTGTLLDGNIRRVFIHPFYQGRGLGKHIMRELEAAARAAGMCRIDLDASLYAKLFYDKLGYETVKPGSIDVGNNQILDYFTMEKRLVK